MKVIKLEQFITTEKINFNTLIQGDCLQVMEQLLVNKSIDMVLADLPYGLTACRWDIIIPLERLWEQYKRIIKDNGVIVLTASQPFTSILVMSNIKWFKYEWIWEKHQGTNPMSANISPLKSHENVLIFSSGRTKYFPQMTQGNPYFGFNSDKFQSEVYGGGKSVHRSNEKGTRYPKTIIKITKDKGKRFHPTQKPIALFEYLIKTYTLENDIVLDNCIGSGTTAVACINTNRNFIGIEMDDKYCQIACKRINEALKNYYSSRDKVKD